MLDCVLFYHVKKTTANKGPLKKTSLEVLLHLMCHRLYFESKQQNHLSLTKQLQIDASPTLTYFHQINGVERTMQQHIWEMSAVPVLVLFVTFPSLACTPRYFLQESPLLKRGISSQFFKKPHFVAAEIRVESLCKSELRGQY